MNPPMNGNRVSRENRLAGAKGRGVGEGRIRSLGLADANYYYR